MLGAIGNTPVVRLVHLVEPGMAEVWVKLEAANPTGSYKDRMALAMIEGAERAGRLRPGQPVVEYTGGSTGSSLAFVCAVTGHPLHIVTSDAFAEEKRRTMEAFGAHVEMLPSPAGITPDLIPRMRARAPRAGRSQLGAYQTDQFTNTDMVEGYRRLGRGARRADPRRRSTRSALYVGTAGCFLGVSRALRAALPRPAAGRGRAGRVGRALRAGRPARTASRAAAIGFRPRPARRRRRRRGHRRLDRRRLRHGPPGRRVEGLFSGPSTGANLVAALELARRLGPGRRVVTIQVDSGLKYLAGAVYVDGA